MKNTANNFCKPWNFVLPSCVVVSIFNIPEPDNNCSTMDAVTIGPIPKDISAPNFAPRIIDKYSN